jgi:hypothetical protein
MTYKPPVAIYDACVLYPFHLRNLLIQCAADRLVDAHWTDDIHDEWIRNLVENSPSVSIERLHRTRDLMEKALPSASVTGHRQHLPNITLPDPDDRHVVAAGIEAGASIIVTWNVRDFPVKELSRHGLRKQKPDAFLLDIYAMAPAAVIAATARARKNLSKSGISAWDFIETLKKQKLIHFAATMTKHVSDL